MTRAPPLFPRPRDANLSHTARSLHDLATFRIPRQHLDHLSALLVGHQLGRPGKKRALTPPSRAELPLSPGACIPDGQSVSEWSGPHCRSAASGGLCEGGFMKTSLSRMVVL